jgi:adenosylhomocysteinase
MADSGVIKRIETILGTGDGYFRAMAELGYEDWSGVRLTVFGSGKVGCGIILQAHRLGARINVVTDPATLSLKYRALCHQVVDYRDAQRVVEVLSESDAVVTATGKCSVVEQYVDKQFFNDKKCLLANMGVEDEFGEAIPADMVLNGKSALNFMLEEPTHLKFIDATMALHNLGALYLVENKDLSGVILPPEQMEQGLLDTTRRFGEIGDILNNIFDWGI